MKKLLILLVLVSSAVFAVSSDLALDVTAGSSSSVSAFSPMTQGVIWEVPYDPDNFNTAYALSESNGWFTADDFITNEGGYVKRIKLYGIDWVPATDVSVLFYDNNNNSPGSLLSTESATYTQTDTGDFFSGYTVYKFSIALDSDFFFDHGTIWMTCNPIDGFWYWMNSEGTGLGYDTHRSEDGGYTWYQVLISCDMMMSIEGSCWDIDETTWGQIKAAF